MDIYGVAFMIQILFSPVSAPVDMRTEEIKIVGVYHKSPKQCVDARKMLMDSNNNPNMKWGCVEAIHPEHEMKLKMQEGLREGSHSH